MESLGGTCLYHDGEMSSGARKLRSLVNKSDLVVCITSCNSHGAMKAIKKQCKLCKTPFCPLKGSSAGALQNLLCELTEDNFFAANV